MLCSACQTTIAEGAKFCPKCGAPAGVPAAESGGKRCPQCGSENPANAKFCKKDGYRFDSDSVAEKPDLAVTPTAPTPAVHVPSAPMASDVVTKKIPPADDSVMCPKCGTPNLVGAKFCKKDGFALQAGVVAPQANVVPKSAPIKQPASAQSVGTGGAATGSKSRKGLVVGALVGVVLLASAGGGYAYWAGLIGNRQGSVQASINAELGSRGLAAVSVTIDREWNAALSGTVLNQADKDQAIAIVQGHKELKKVSTEMIQIPPRTADLEKNLNQALIDAGVGNVTATVDQEMVALLRGEVVSTDQKAQALKVAQGVPGLKNVIDNIHVIAIESIPQAVPSEPVPPAPAAPAPTPASVPQPSVKMAPPQRPQPSAIDPAKLEGDINRALRSQNVNGVSAQVGDDLSVTLKGSGSASEKSRAIQVVRQFREVRAVKDKIFVVE